MTIQAPPPAAPKVVQPNEAAGSPPDSPGQVAYPTARPVVPPPEPDAIDIESTGPQSYQGGVWTLEHDVVITYKDRRVAADHVVYDANTGDVTLTGHVLVTDGSIHERIAASHGTYNIRTEIGRFFDVTGSYGLTSTPRTRQTTYTTDSPFLFTGRVVTKLGINHYEVYDGTVTSCQLPSPDWLLSAAHITIQDDQARARNSWFHLLNVPILFLPYVTHPVNSEARESGLLIPTLGYSNSKGFILGEEGYIALNRSLDLRLGVTYYSQLTAGTPAGSYASGWADNATLRYRGAGLDYALFHFSNVVDGRAAAYNEGGEEAVLSARRDLSAQTRAAVSLDYLSSYLYREAFSDTFNQAVTSDIVSTAYITRQVNGTETSGLADRYQGIKVITTTPEQQVHIFHAPSLGFNTTEHLVPGTGTAVSNGLEVTLESSASGLKRTQPGFETGGIVERFDLHPQASYPMLLHGWSVVPTLATRETIYSRSRQTPVAGQPAAQSEASLNRADLEFGLAIRMPPVERVFHPRTSSTGVLGRVLGSELRHVIEPELNYRITDGISNFANVLRFDPIDVASNTNELEYGLTQRIYRRAAGVAGTRDKPCPTEALASSPGFTTDAPNSADDMVREIAPALNAAVEGQCPSEELISWRLTQRFFFDQSFGGAVVNGRRNVFTSTLDLSGVAFITQARELSPLISRMRVRTSAHTDLEWDFDFDTSLTKFNSSNVYVDLHQGAAFGALSYARLDAPGRFYTENPDSTTTTTGFTSSISDFNQLRVLGGYGNPAKPGLSIAANAGLDLKHFYGTASTSSTSPLIIFPPLLQYASVQASYNWNCCGLAIEYRKLELGSVNNDGTFRFNFTLANIGAAGNLRRAERLF